MKRIISIIASTLIAIALMPAIAQSSIDAAIHKIESSRTPTKDDVFSEKRNPKTKRVYKSSRLMVLSAADAQVLAKAITSSRTSASEFKCIGNEVFSIIFEKGTERKRYTLTRDGRKWLLLVDIVDPANSPGRGSRTTLDFDNDIVPEINVEMPEINFNYVYAISVDIPDGGCQPSFFCHSVDVKL